MNATQARWLERSIIGICVLSILLIFQPFSMQLFTSGCVMVVVGALIFNLIPFCRPGVSGRELARVMLIVFVILLVAAILGIGTAFLYVGYLDSLR